MSGEKCSSVGVRLEHHDLAVGLAEGELEEVERGREAAHAREQVEDEVLDGAVVLGALDEGGGGRRGGRRRRGRGRAVLPRG